MKFRTLKRGIAMLGITLTVAYAAGSEYWDEFERENKRTGVTLIKHVQNLSTISNSVSSKIRKHTKNALAYFFATGGKYGFRPEPATAEEYVILVKALVVTNALHYSEKPSKTLNLMEIREKTYHLSVENEIVRNHLLYAQTIIGYGSCISKYLDRNSMVLLGQKELGICVSFPPLKEPFTKLKESELKSVIINELTLPIFEIIASTLKPKQVRDISNNDLEQIKLLLNVVLSPKRSPRQILLKGGGTYTYIPASKAWRVEKSTESTIDGSYQWTSSFREMGWELPDEGHIFFYLWKRGFSFQEIIF